MSPKKLSFSDSNVLLTAFLAMLTVVLTAPSESAVAIDQQIDVVLTSILAQH